ncbi:MAG: hypothetical protein ACMXYL_01780 [Candidatus Woesearchaeota archaeon]
MRAEIVFRKDNVPLIEVGFSQHNLEQLLAYDIMTPMSSTGKNGIRRLLGSMIGVSLNNNGIAGIKHDYRSLHGKAIDDAIAHFIEISKEEYDKINSQERIEYDAKTAIIILANTGTSPGGSPTTAYNQGYIASYALPGINPYARDGI